MAAVNATPAGYPRLCPSLTVDGASAAIDFYCTVFGAALRVEVKGPDGKLVHAELQFGDSVLMLVDEFPEMGFRSPKNLGGTPVTLSLYVTDVDDVFARAVAAGARVLHPIENAFYGDRTGVLEDPFGHRWNVATHVEDVPAVALETRRHRGLGGDGAPAFAPATSA